MTDKDSTNISSYIKWEQAFRVFSNIYTSFHPTRGEELIQYNHIIHTASQTFLWDNVYRYDREFCIQMAKHHLNLSWAVILQQAWSMFLKDKVSNYSGGNYRGGNSGRNVGGNVRRKLCFDFN